MQISLGKVWRYQTCKHNQTIEGQKYNDKRNWVNNDLQNTTQKTKESEKRTQQRHSGEIRCSMRIYSSCSPNDTRRGNRINHIQLKSTLSEYIVSFLIFFILTEFLVFFVYFDHPFIRMLVQTLCAPSMITWL